MRWKGVLFRCEEIIVRELLVSGHCTALLKYTPPDASQFPETDGRRVTGREYSIGLVCDKVGQW